MAKSRTFLLPLAIVAMAGLHAQVAQANDTLRFGANDVFTIKLDAASKGTFKVKGAGGNDLDDLVPGSSTSIQGKSFTLVAPFGGRYDSYITLQDSHANTISFNVKGTIGKPVVTDQKASSPSAYYKIDNAQIDGKGLFVGVQSF